MMKFTCKASELRKALNGATKTSIRVRWAAEKDPTYNTYALILVGKTEVGGCVDSFGDETHEIVGDRLRNLKKCLDMCPHLRLTVELGDSITLKPEAMVM